MKKLPQKVFSPFIFIAAFYCTSVFAFSSTPSETEAYIPADWSESTSAEADAQYAIDNKDFRLLGFAGRGYDIPGIDVNKKQSYIDKCGIRLFEEFSDVVRSKKQLEEMQQARNYAVRYNQVAIPACRQKN